MLREKDLNKFEIHLSNGNVLTYSTILDLISVVDKFTRDDGVLLNGSMIFKHHIVKITEVK